jgi:SpoVK/Ycf46/Vps4 family AAA+-type ATPase
LLDELMGMVGLGSVKRSVTELVDLIAVEAAQREAGMRTPPMSRHLVFAGAPGTGKTSVARLYGRILTALGVIPGGQLLEVGRSDLVAGYIGQTAARTRDQFERARGGVLFIDEAYALAPRDGAGQDFGVEAIDELVKLMEEHRDDTVVIAAGYTDRMTNFLAVNPGLASRFGGTLQFEDYANDELVTIFCTMADANGFVIPDETRAALLAWFTALPRDDRFANGRTARNVFERSRVAMAGRVRRLSDPTPDALRTIEPEDVSGIVPS